MMTKQLRLINCEAMPEDLKEKLADLPNIDGYGEETLIFKANPNPDPEWGNEHVPITRWLLKNGAHKLETVGLINYQITFEYDNKKTDLPNV